MLRVIPQDVGAALTEHCAWGCVRPSICPAMRGSGLLPTPLARHEPGNNASGRISAHSHGKVGF